MTQQAASKVGPISLLLDLRKANYWELIDAIANECRSAANPSRIRVGLILGPNGPRSSVEMSTYREGAGRALASERRNLLPGQERLMLERLASEIAVLESISGWSPRDLSRWECVSFSAMSDELVVRIIGICRSQGAFVAAFRWHPTDSYAGLLLWSHLPLKKVITESVVLTDYEEFPDNLHEEENCLVWTPDRAPEHADGFFWEFGSDVHVERALLHIQLPPDLELSKAFVLPLTPLQRAAASVGTRTVLRKSSNDIGASRASYELPTLSEHYPDLLSTETKVRDYCLNRLHPLRKWEGFEPHGWGWHSTDALVVAANICGALLGEFTPEEAVATSEGALQFSVGMVLPSATRFRAPLTTAWIAEPGRPTRLTTAYISSERTEYADVPRMVAPDADLQDVWDELMVMAEELADRWNGDTVRTRARVFIPRNGKANTLTRRLVREHADHGTFSRSALGGRSLLVPIGPEMSWSASAAVGSFVQIQLGLHGVRSIVDIWVD